jgi:hypothetical protein
MFCMISGFAEHWQCPSGEWAIWTPDAATREAMNNAPDLGVEASFIQADYLRSSIEGESRVRRLVFTSFTVHDKFDAEIIADVFTDFVRAHQAFHAAFSVTTDLRPRGRTLRPEQISLTVSARSSDHPDRTVKEHLIDSAPTLHEWAAFAFAVNEIENASREATDPRFQVVLCSTTCSPCSSREQTVPHPVTRWPSAGT